MKRKDQSIPILNSPGLARVVGKMLDIPATEAHIIQNATWEAIIEHIKKGGQVRIFMFGKFYGHKKPRRKNLRHFRTGELLESNPNHRKLKFVEARRCKRIMQEKEET